MKAILISDYAKWCALMMNGIKTIEVRKNKALASAIQNLINEYGYAEIYVYCSKDKKYANLVNRGGFITGMVAFKFRCYKVEEHTASFSNDIGCQSADLFVDEETEQILKKACLTNEELYKYLNANLLDEMDTDYKTFFAIYIHKLEVFDKPRELNEFKRYHEPSEHSACWKCKRFGTGCVSCSITKAPQNFCYVEVLK